MEAVNLGIQLSIYGIVITFLSLGALILVILLLRMVFPSPQEKEAARAGTEFPSDDSSEDQNARLAALTAAWWYWQKKRSSSLGKQLEQGPGKRWRKSDKA